MNVWKTYKISDIAFINRKSITNGYPHRIIKYIDTSSVTENCFSTPMELEITSAPSRAKRIVSKGDILYSTVRPNQKHFGIVKELYHDFIASTGFAVITTKPIVNSGFLYYWLTQPSIIEYLNSIAEAQTTTFPAINPIDIGKLEIKLPPLSIQQRIGEILGALDDKIELNRQMNQTLEELAQTLFKHNFVDGIDPEHLPEGWRMGRFGEHFNVVMGQSPAGSSYNTEGIGELFFQGRTDFEFRFPAPRMYTTEPKRYADKFDTLVSVRAPVGDLNIAVERCCIGRGLASVQHKEYKPSFTYYTLLKLHGEFEKYQGEGTVFGSINKDDFNNIKLVIPPIEKVNDFECNAEAWDFLIFNNWEENIQLTSIRDYLLPKLISGEIIPTDHQPIEQLL